MSLNDKPTVEELSQKRPIAKSVLFGFFFYGFLAGLGLLIIIFFGWHFLTGAPIFSSFGETEAQTAPALTEPEQAGPGPLPKEATTSATPADAMENLQKNIEEVFAQVGVANQTKDLSLFLKAYSPTFPQLSRKAREITRIWKTYDYLAMDFTIPELKPLPDNRVLARVTWNIETQNRRTKARQKLAKTYLTWLAQESGHWHIIALEKVK